MSTIHSLIPASVFVINALVDNVCTALTARGQCAREMTLVFFTRQQNELRASRASCALDVESQGVMRLIRRSRHDCAGDGVIASLFASRR